jgi:hypothetical protein
MSSPRPALPPLRLIVAYAAPAGDRCRQALPGLRLPRLAQLLARLPRQRHPETSGSETPDPAGDPACEAAGLSLPHERALARALGLPDADGRVPWAAWDRLQAGDPQALGAAWAWITPCHWAVGSDHIAMRPPLALQLADAESRSLLEAMQPYFQEDGLVVTWESALRWRACGEMLRALPCASLDRVVGRAVDAWLPRTPEARPLRRLQQEMQMLLYTHPVNEAREREGALTVNSFWVEGAGALNAPPTPSGEEVRLDERLRAAALLDDAPAWTAAWQSLETQVLAPALADLATGRAVHLTLAGERTCAHFGPMPQDWLQRLRTRWQAPATSAVLDSL